MARNRIIGVRVDEKQSAEFEKAAKRAGKKVSDWLRELGAAAVVAGRKPKAPVAAGALAELARDLVGDAISRLNPGRIR